MHKKSSHKKKRKRGKSNNGIDKENDGCVESDNSCPRENGGDGNSCHRLENGDETTREKSPCYEIKYSDVMGRYLVASRDIEPGEVILDEDALVLGPITGCDIICLACYQKIDDVKDIVKCNGCKWPLCQQDCSGVGDVYGHPKYECDLLAACFSPDYGHLDKLKDSYQAIVPLRCLLLKTEDPAKWSVIEEMVSHNDIRRALPAVWGNNEQQVVRRLRGEGGLLQYTEEEIHTVCGILEVNAFEVGPVGCNARALFGNAYLLAHACTPSTSHTDRGKRALTVRAATAHRKGDLISLSYAYTLQGTLKRREHLLRSKFFSCSCRRCADPRELGTLTSAFRCPRCAAGLVLPARPLRQDAPWQCTAAAPEGPCCGYNVPANAVTMLIDRITDEFEQIDANDVPNFENFLHKYRNVLHPNHYLCLSAKHSLSQLYGKTSEYMIHEMPVAELNRKIEICRDIMKIFDVLEPGYSRLRGITLYELHAPLMILTTRDFEKRTISKDNLRTRLKEVVQCLLESAKILGFEPKNTAEGLMATAATDALRRIKDWEKIIGNIC